MVIVYCPPAGLSLRRAEFIPLFTERIEIRSTTKLPAGSIVFAVRACSEVEEHFDSLEATDGFPIGQDQRPPTGIAP